VLAVPIAATTAVLVRYAVRYYEHTSFFGHESDADVVITPAMALIMPGVMPGAKIIGTEHEPDVVTELAPDGGEGEGARSLLDVSADQWMFESELPLGPSGRAGPAAPQPAAPPPPDREPE
jgi:hypothetical protein